VIRTTLRGLHRLLLSAIFISGGVDALRQPAPQASMIQDTGIPEPRVAVRVNGGAMVLGGAALALGVKPKLAALLLIGSLVPTTLAGHRFWSQDSAQATKQQQTQFVKNLGLLGGLVGVLAYPERSRQTWRSSSERGSD
jgi:putative oxidoreductase